jgi:uncharacterized membrane protein YvbJ
MPLIKCPACGREISNRAVACPGCGHPISSEQSSQNEATVDNSNNSDKKPVSPGAIILSIIILIIMICIGWSMSSSYISGSGSSDESVKIPIGEVEITMEFEED